MNESETGDVSEILAVDNRYFFIVAIRGEHPCGYRHLRGDGFAVEKYNNV